MTDEFLRQHATTTMFPRFDYIRFCYLQLYLLTYILLLWNSGKYLPITAVHQHHQAPAWEKHCSRQFHFSNLWTFFSHILYWTGKNRAMSEGHSLNFSGSARMLFKARIMVYTSMGAHTTSKLSEHPQQLLMHRWRYQTKRGYIANKKLLLSRSSKECVLLCLLH